MKENYEPAVAGRQLGLLQAVLNPDLEGGDFMDKLVTHENLVRRYETVPGETLGDAIRTATLLKHAPEQIKSYLQLQSRRVGTTYAELRTSIRDFLDSRRDWTTGSSSSTAKYDNGPQPMQVDALHHQSDRKGKKGGTR